MAHLVLWDHLGIKALLVSLVLLENEANLVCPVPRVSQVKEVCQAMWPPSMDLLDRKVNVEMMETMGFLDCQASLGRKVTLAKRGIRACLEETDKMAKEVLRVILVNQDHLVSLEDKVKME